MPSTPPHHVDERSARVVASATLEIVELSSGGQRWAHEAGVGDCRHRIGSKLRAFRNWAPKYAEDFFVRGRLRVMPASFYRTVEDAAPGVRDEFENAAVARHRPLRVTGALSIWQRAYMEYMGFRIDGASRNGTFFGNQLITHGPEVYILCMTSRSEHLLDQGHVVTTIGNVEDLGRAMLEAGNGMFTAMQFGAVEYGPIDYVILEGHREPNPFRKRPEYEYQQEVRIALTAAPGVSGEKFLESMAMPWAVKHAS